ncbi:MAG: hypothetical protein R3F43_01620 [bacterium]
MNTFVAHNLDGVLDKVVAVITSPDTARQISRRAQKAFDRAMDFPGEKIAREAEKLPWDDLLEAVPGLIAHNLGREAVPRRHPRGWTPPSRWRSARSAACGPTTRPRGGPRRSDRGADAPGGRLRGQQRLRRVAGGLRPPCRRRRPRGRASEGRAAGAAGGPGVPGPGGVR